MRTLRVIVGTLAHPLEVQRAIDNRRGFIAWQSTAEVHVNWEGDHPQKVPILGRDQLFTQELS
jgi:hypothetical protein